ncbi:hypothetical protein OCHUTO_1036 [Orientia chuto str. Dubai]|uniref:Integrase DNA-binding domain-containing protein n=1 Tax=Orientia chuto str. Dubai TaxID=1359168 RepID=A0A0F3MGV5_9RICK|nr:integrase arm-type DNA-binding domain-containing protein [Candidatus Orientia mediorientalis]KJV54896.1 hypothetical protein OCHUTO_1036 [Orientia chuto str. Dubai]
MEEVFYLAKSLRGVTRRIKIGASPDLSIGYARQEARRLKTLIAKGINPNEEKRKQYMEDKKQRILNREERKASGLTFVHNKYINEFW